MAARVRGMRRSLGRGSRHRCESHRVKIDAHQTKAERIERSLAKCTLSDYETVIEGAMLAGTHWFNVLLHRMALRGVENDAMHAEFIPHGERRKLSVAIPRELQALDEIERLRTTHVRGD